MSDVVVFVVVLIFYGLRRLSKRRTTMKDLAMPLMEEGGTPSGCSYCGKFCITRCFRCKAAPYCSEVCQSEHWKSGHKYECVEQTDQERARYLEKELAKSKKEIAVLKSDCKNWASYVSRELRRVSEEHQSECARLKTELELQRIQVITLKQELSEAQIARTEVEEIRSVELMNALNDFENAKSRADVAERKCANQRRELQGKQMLVQKLKQKQDEAQIAKKKVEEISQELAKKLDDLKQATSRANVAEKKCANQRRELHEKHKLVQKLKQKQDEFAQIAKRKAEGIIPESVKKPFDDMKNEWIKTKRELEEERQLVHLLKQECEETRQSATRQVEEKKLELANALDAAAAAEAKLIDHQQKIKSSDDKACAICLTNEKDMAFGCGHVTCQDCGNIMSSCPICRKRITLRIKLFSG